MIYVLICLCLSLAGVAGLQLFYLLYLERLNNERRKRISVLERRLKLMNVRLAETEEIVASRKTFVEPDEDVLIAADEEIWADVIDER